MDQTKSTSRTWIIWAIAGAVLVLGTYAVVGFSVLNLFQPNPNYPSLAAAPDPSLSGTVAYFDDESLCVRAVAASGEHDREVYCIEQEQPADPMTEGKNVGVDIVWLPDDRLELTLFRMSMSKDPGPPTFFPAWQRIVDVRSGAVEDVPASQFANYSPSRPCLTTSPTGEDIVTNSADGHAVVTLKSPSGERTLLDVQGDPETYGIQQACWAPNYQWVYTSDTRMLVITTGDEPVTRSLTPEMVSFYGYDALSWYAVTASNLLTD